MLCPGRESPPVSETADLHIGLIMVSGRRPLHPRGSILECPSGPMCCYFSSGGWDFAGVCRLSGAGRAAGHGSCGPRGGAVLGCRIGYDG